MKKVLGVGVLLGALVAVNACIDSVRECACDETCWCKRPGLRHFRWLVPYRHTLDV